MKTSDSITTIHTRTGKLISYEEARDLLIVEPETGGSSIVIDLSNNKVTIHAEGDIEFSSNQKIKLAAKEGIELRTEGETQLVAQGETIIQGKMVRIN